MRKAKFLLRFWPGRGDRSSLGTPIRTRSPQEATMSPSLPSLLSLRSRALPFLAPSAVARTVEGDLEVVAR